MRPLGARVPELVGGRSCPNSRRAADGCDRTPSGCARRCARSPAARDRVDSGVVSQPAAPITKFHQPRKSGLALSVAIAPVTEGAAARKASGMFRASPRLVSGRQHQTRREEQSNRSLRGALVAVHKLCLREGSAIVDGPLESAAVPRRNRRWPAKPVPSGLDIIAMGSRLIRLAIGHAARGCASRAGVRRVLGGGNAGRFADAGPGATRPRWTATQRAARFLCARREALESAIVTSGCNEQWRGIALVRRPAPGRGGAGV